MADLHQTPCKCFVLKPGLTRHAAIPAATFGTSMPASYSSHVEHGTGRTFRRNKRTSKTQHILERPLAHSKTRRPSLSLSSTHSSSWLMAFAAVAWDSNPRRRPIENSSLLTVDPFEAPGQRSAARPPLPYTTSIHSQIWTRNMEQQGYLAKWQCVKTLYPWWTSK